MIRKRNPTPLSLTKRALRDIRGIERYSVERWGKRAAKKYIDDLEAALNRLQQEPQLLQQLPDFHPSLRFYRINQHLLVCDLQAASIVVLTVLHVSMNIPNRLAEIQPTLTAEVELLHRKLRQGK